MTNLHVHEIEADRAGLGSARADERSRLRPTSCAMMRGLKQDQVTDSYRLPVLLH
jgi:hypothetical protein